MLLIFIIAIIIVVLIQLIEIESFRYSAFPLNEKRNLNISEISSIKKNINQINTLLFEEVFVIDAFAV